MSNCDRVTAASMIAAGHSISKAGMHKTMLPTNPRPGFEWRLGPATLNKNKNKCYIQTTEPPPITNHVIVFENMVDIKDNEKYEQEDATAKCRNGNNASRGKLKS
jgi:hypothetical protein